MENKYDKDFVVCTKDALYNLGVGYARKNFLAESVYYYRMAAEQGHVNAQYNLGVMYYKGEGVPQNKIEALKWLTLSASQGDAFAQFNLGVMFYNGEGLPKNYSEAVKWYTLAASQGDSFAQFNLGRMFYNGEGVEQNYSEALKWFVLAANQGDDGAKKAVNLLQKITSAEINEAQKRASEFVKQ